MPRPRKSTGGRILDYFRHAEPGEARAIYGLAGDILKDRSTVPAAPKAPKAKRARKAAPAAQPTQEVTQ